MKALSMKDKHIYIVVMCEKPRFVTDLNYLTKEAKWELTGTPYEFSDYDEAANICCGLAWNGTIAYPVILRWKQDTPLYSMVEKED